MSRGTRNRNPGNIRHGSPWNGLATEQTDDEFCQFVCATYGIRAMAKLLLNYERLYHLFTIPDILARYAPAHENNLQAYIDFVCKETGFTPHNAVNLKERDNMRALICAMIHFENGMQPYTYEIEDGITLAYG